MENLFEAHFPLYEWARHQVVAVEIKQIESVIDYLCFPAEPVGSAPHAYFILQELKFWHALFVEGDNLAIDDRFFCFKLFAEVLQFRILGSHINLIARN